MRAASLKHRLCVPALPVDASTTDANDLPPVTLAREQTHYLANVLRLRAGQNILVFNGRGVEFTAQIAQLDRRTTTLELGELTNRHPANSPRLTLGVALLKNQAMDFALQKATELGVDTIRLLTTDRTNSSLSTERLNKRIAHWDSVIKAACEQSGRCWLPTLQAPIKLTSLLAELADDSTESAFLLAPGGGSLESFPQKNTTVLIGPEGGWSESELDSAQQCGVHTRKLGTTILRAETACVSALSSVQQDWHWPSRH